MAAIEYLLDRAKGDGILEVVLIVVAIVLILFILIALSMLKFVKFFKDQVNIQTNNMEEDKKKEELLIQNQKDLAELRSDMNDSLMRIETMIEKIANNDDKQNSIIQDQLAHTITETCNKVLEREDQSIKASELQTILRLYNSYSKPPINGNSFVHILVLQCTKLHIVKDGTEEYIENYSHIQDELNELEKNISNYDI